MKAYILRVAGEGRRWWVLADQEHVMGGKQGETLDQIKQRWRDKYGAPASWVKYTGLHRQSEAAATVASIKQGEL